MAERGPRIYDATASVYDAISALIPFEAALRAAAAEALGSVTGGAVLDLGCGTGLSLPGMARALGPSGRVVGVDTSSKSVRVAAHRAKKLGLSFEAFAADASTAPWGPQRFAGAISIFALSVIAEWEQTISHAFTALLPGASLVVLEQRYPSRGLIQILNPVARVLNLALAADPTRDFAKAMTEAGFQTQTTYRLSGFYALHVGQRPRQ